MPASDVDNEHFDSCCVLPGLHSTVCFLVILQDYYAAIKGESCKSQVHKYLELAAEDLRFDVSLADACYKDRVTLCAKVPPVSLQLLLIFQQGSNHTRSAA